MSICSLTAPSRFAAHRPLKNRLLLILLLLPLFVALAATVASAAPILIQFTGTVDLSYSGVANEISAGDTISGILELDDSTPGVFTPTPNPTFIQSEILYTGAIVAVELTVNGITISGSDGDMHLLDSADPFAGSDFYEGTAYFDSGTLGSVTANEFIFVPEYDHTTFVLADGDPLGDPPTFDPAMYNFFVINTSSGAASGRLDSFEVPEPAFGLALVTGALALAGVRRRN